MNTAGRPVTVTFQPGKARGMASLADSPTESATTNNDGAGAAGVDGAPATTDTAHRATTTMTSALRLIAGRP